MRTAKIILATIVIVGTGSAAMAQNARWYGEPAYYSSQSYGPAQYNSNKGGVGENGGG